MPILHKDIACCHIYCVVAGGEAAILDPAGWRSPERPFWLQAAEWKAVSSGCKVGGALWPLFRWHPPHGQRTDYQGLHGQLET